jgi:hypothetical protein
LPSIGLLALSLLARMLRSDGVQMKVDGHKTFMGAAINTQLP